MYTRTWNKYLPAIRILFKRASTGDQKMDLSRMDFENGSRNRKLTCSFNIELERGRLNNVTQSAAAKCLVTVLQQDDVIKNLLKQYRYAITLNASFQLTIKNLTPPAITIDDGVAKSIESEEDKIPEDIVN